MRLNNENSRLTFLSFFLFVLLIGSSCTRRYYYPKPLTPPLLTAPRQVRLSGMSNLAVANPIGALSIAGSPLKHLGLQLSVASAAYKETITTNGTPAVSVQERQWNPEVGAGYYVNLSKVVVFEVYSGWGRYNYTNDAPAFVKSLKHRVLFLQPSIALVDKNVEMAFTLRYDHLQRHYQLLDASQGDPTDAAFVFLNYGGYGFLEPAFTMRVGGKTVMAQFQLSQNIALDKGYSSIYGRLRKSGDTRIAVGAIVNLHSFFNQRGE